MTLVEFITNIGMIGAGQDDVIVMADDDTQTITGLDLETEDDGTRVLVLTIGDRPQVESSDVENGDDTPPDN